MSEGLLTSIAHEMSGYGALDWLFFAAALITVITFGTMACRWCFIKVLEFDHRLYSKSEVDAMREKLTNLKIENRNLEDAISEKDDQISSLTKIVQEVMSYAKENLAGKSRQIIEEAGYELNNYEDARNKESKRSDRHG
ncbi:MAG: hypothetical protein AAFN79_09855 [Pseudomonadota bacterium]